MARAGSTDYLQSFRFQASVINSGQDFIGFSNTDTGVGGEAGFQNVTVPEITADMVEYREGIFKYTKKFQGVPTVSNVTMQRGVVLGDTKFLDWIMSGINGGDYRCDIEIKNFARDDTFEASQAERSNLSGVGFTRYRSIKCFECIPTRVKPIADLEASAADVSMADVDFELEYFTMEDVNA